MFVIMLLLIVYRSLLLLPMATTPLNCGVLAVVEIKYPQTLIVLQAYIKQVLAVTPKLRIV